MIHNNQPDQKFISFTALENAKQMPSKFNWISSFFWRVSEKYLSLILEMIILNSASTGQKVISVTTIR